MHCHFTIDNVIRSFQSHQFDQETLLNVPCQVCKMNRNADFRSFKRRGSFSSLVWALDLNTCNDPVE